MPLTKIYHLEIIIFFFIIVMYCEGLYDSFCRVNTLKEMLKIEGSTEQLSQITIGK